MVDMSHFTSISHKGFHKLSVHGYKNDKYINVDNKQEQSIRDYGAFNPAVLLKAY
jgi:hypothetical protein